MKKVPFVPQLAASDCAVAALAMVLGYHGVRVRRASLRAALREPARDGVSAFAVVQAAERFGVRAIGRRVSASAVRDLPPATLLHWERRHFVVFERADRRGVWIVDPAIGRRHVDTAELERAFAGLALEMQPGEHRGEPAAPSPAWRILRAKRFAWAACASLALAIAAVAGALTVSSPGWLMIVAAGYLALAFGRRALLERGGRDVEADLAAATLEALATAPRSFHRDRARADLARRLASVAAVRASLEESAGSIFTDALAAVAGSILLAFVAPWVAIAVGALVVVQNVVGWVARAHERRRRIPGAEEALRAFERRVIDAPATFDDAGRARWEALHRAAAPRPRTVAAAGDAFVVIGPLLLLAACARTANTIDAAVIACALALVTVRSLAGLMATAGRFGALAERLERIDDVLLAVEAPAPRLPLLPLRVEGVSLRYGPDAPPAIDGVDLILERGRVLLVQGDGGAGKSSLCAVLAGDARPTAGKLRAPDGVIVGPTALRAAVVRVDAARPTLEGTVREAIAAAAPTVRVVDVARSLGVHDAIAAMPLGYDTPVVGGEALPGGVRCLVGLARAALAEPEILILDDALAVLDPRAARRAIEGLKTLGCAVVVASARHIDGADDVLVLDGGRPARGAPRVRSATA